MKNNPDLFQKLFVLGETELSPADVIDVLEFPASLHDDDEEATTKGYLIAFLQAPCLPNFGLGKITVKFESDDPSVFASACLNSLSLPKSFPNQEVFSPSLEAIINTASKSCHSTVFDIQENREMFFSRLVHRTFQYALT